MTIPEIVHAIKGFCRAEGIQIIRGQVSSADGIKVRNFLFTFKSQYKSMKRFQNQEPKPVGDIINKLKRVAG